MKAIDPNCSAPTIAQVVAAKSVGLPPLQWHIRPDRASMAKLTGMTLSDLFDPKPVTDDAAARCVLAGLTLRCGFGAAVPSA